MKNIMNLFCSKVIFDEYDLKNVEKLKQKTKTLEKFNGKMVAYGRRGLRLEFKTKEDEKAYFSYIKKESFKGKDFSKLIDWGNLYLW